MKSGKALETGIHRIDLEVGGIAGLHRNIEDVVHIAVGPVSGCIHEQVSPHFGSSLPNDPAVLRARGKFRPVNQFTGVTAFNKPYRRIEIFPDFLVHDPAAPAVVGVKQAYTAGPVIVIDHSVRGFHVVGVELQILGAPKAIGGEHEVGADGLSVRDGRISRCPPGVHESGVRLPQKLRAL